MDMDDIKLSWAEINPIKINEITEYHARKFLRSLAQADPDKGVDVYVCSDARMNGVRQQLSGIPWVNILNTAGNVIYSPNKRASVVIAHGDSNYSGCGAVDYASNRTDGENPVFTALAAEVKGEPIENARYQLSKVDEEFRSGVIYFNHEKGIVEKVDKDGYQNPEYCDMLFKILSNSLDGIYTEEETTAMKDGQNPEIIFFNNLNTPNTAFELFRINMQNDRYHDILRDSLCYSMDHSLKEGSFMNTKTTFLAFRQDKGGIYVPDEMGKILEEKFVKDYIARDGDVFLVSLGDLPDSKKVYRITPK